MQQNDLEYAIVVETPHYGEMGIILRDGGRHLGLARTGDPSLYKLLGEEPPHKVKIGYNTIFKGVKPDWKISLHGEWQNIGDIVEQLYSQTVDVVEEVASHNDFFYRHSIACYFGSYFAAALPWIATALVLNYTDIPMQLPYSIAGTWTAGVVGGIIYYSMRLKAERKRKNEIDKDSITHLRGLESVREGIIRAGVLDGILPQDYGLPK